ncbi:MAG: glycosyltransferase family 39 protein, partial [Acidobacteria bacterium]|nr:glycosyltransferase family 39 protein [Acidobacteriota bacterium]
MRRRRFRPEVALAIACLALFAALALHGAGSHPIERVGGAEQDGHVARAEGLLEGEMPRDPLRPPLYPLLVAAVASLGIEPFAAARLVSNLASTGLAALAWGFGRRFGGLSSAWLAFALVGAHPFVWTGGQEAATDPLFAMFGALGWLAALVWLERPARSTALAGGAALGLAFLTRGSALFLLPGFLLLPLFAARRGEGRRPLPWRDLAAAAALCAALVAPLLGLRYLQFGDPFHDENWRNLAYKLFGRGDWSYLARAPFDGVASVVAADPGRFVRSGIEQLRVLVAGGGGFLFVRI